MIVSTDLTDPFDCADGIESVGPLTMTPLALDHDEDGDGCTDWQELGPGGPEQRDPFNPDDCLGPGAVGGIAELIETAAPGSAASAAWGSRAASWAVAAVAAAFALGPDGDGFATARVRPTLVAVAPRRAIREVFT